MSDIKCPDCGADEGFIHKDDCSLLSQDAFAIADWAVKTHDTLPAIIDVIDAAYARLAVDTIRTPIQKNLCPDCGADEGMPHAYYCRTPAIYNGYLQMRSFTKAFSSGTGDIVPGPFEEYRVSSAPALVGRLCRPVETYFNTVDYNCGILAARAAELRTKSEASTIFDAERIKYAFAAKEIEKLIEEIKAP